MRTLLLTVLLAAPAAADQASLAAMAGGCVVQVEKRVPAVKKGQGPSVLVSEGFVADLAAGLVATSMYAGEAGQASYRVIFRDGSSAKARLAYLDPFNGFAFLRLAAGAPRSGVSEAAFARQGALNPGDEVFLAAWPGKNGRPAGTGKVTVTGELEPPRQTFGIKTSLGPDAAPGGSPVFNAKGAVAAMRAVPPGGRPFELPAAYITDALYALKAGMQPRRGDPLAALAAMPMNEALAAGSLTTQAAARITRSRPGTSRVLMVKTSQAGSGLKPGDAVIAVNGAVVGDDAYLYDRLMDMDAGGTASIDICRNGAEVTLKVPVADANAKGPVTAKK